MSVRSAVRAAAPAAAIFLLAGCLLALAYYHDNKYLSPPPYGADGVLELTDADLGRPVPLVDGWLLSVDGAPAAEAFIGQYSNFSFAPGGTSAFGSAVYELELRYDGDAPERALVLLVPEVYGDFTLYVDGAVEAAGGDGAQVGIVVRDGTRLELEVENREHYYSGLYYPPVLGTAQAMGQLDFANALGTCVLVLGPLAAALLSFAVRRRGDGDALVGDFGVLCLAFAVAGAHGLAWRAGIAGAWYILIRTTDHLDSCSLKCKSHSLAAIRILQILDRIHIVYILVLCPIAPVTYICDSFVRIINLAGSNRFNRSHCCTLFRFISFYNRRYLILHCSKRLVCCCICISCCCQACLDADYITIFYLTVYIVCYIASLFCCYSIPGKFYILNVCTKSCQSCRSCYLSGCRDIF